MSTSMMGAGIVVAVCLSAFATIAFFVLVVVPFGVDLLQARKWIRLQKISGAALKDRTATQAAAKPRVRIRPDSWIRHDGGAFPFAPNAVVETAHAGGFYARGRQAEYASFWPETFWRGEATSWRNNILFYRIIRMPTPAFAPGGR